MFVNLNVLFSYFYMCNEILRLLFDALHQTFVLYFYYFTTWFKQCPFIYRDSPYVYISFQSLILQIWSMGKIRLLILIRTLYYSAADNFQKHFGKRTRSFHFFPTCNKSATDNFEKTHLLNMKNLFKWKYNLWIKLKINKRVFFVGYIRRHLVINSENIYKWKNNYWI